MEDDPVHPPAVLAAIWADTEEAGFSLFSDYKLGGLLRVLAASKPGGRLLVVDFAPHGHEELRTQDAHARLGFSDDQMEQWFAASGLEMSEIRELAGSELTVKLWLGSRKANAGLKVVSA